MVVQRNCTTPPPFPYSGRIRMRYSASVALLALAALPLAAQDHGNKANWQLADKFSPQNLRSRIYTSAVNPRWLGQSDSLCYDWKDHTGNTFFLVIPTSKTKRPLFDHAKLAAQLSEQSHRAHDPQNLPFSSLTFAKDHKSFTFNADSSKWEWTLATEALTRVGPANPTPAGGRGRGAGTGTTPAVQADTANTCGGGGGRGGAQANGGGQGGRGGGGGEFRNFSPDSSMFAFARAY